MSHKELLDHGSVRLLAVLGDDLDIVNAARVSYDKATTWTEGEDGRAMLRAKDARLLGFLIDHGHTSPLRHQVAKFEIYAPLMVMRQWGKYRVGSTWTWEVDYADDPLETWNESSRRYITEQEEFYLPEVWRAAPENSKQGSGGAVDGYLNTSATEMLRLAIGQAVCYYRWMLREGIAPEQARLILPAYALYVRARWTVSLDGIVHFLMQRLKPDAQWEIRQYAAAVRDLVEPHFPVTVRHFGLDRDAATTDTTP